MHYGDEKLTYNCIKSITEGKIICTFEVIIINNDRRTILDMIRRTWPCIQIVDAKENIGYARAVNLGCALARGDFLVILNNDVVVEEDCLEKLVLCLKKNPRVGFCVPIKYNMSNPALLDGAGGAINLLLETWDVGNFEFAREEFTRPREIIYPPGAAYAVRREIATFYGNLLDDDFFMYFDDPDIGARSFFAGYTGLLVPSARIYHKRGASSDSNSPLSHFYFSRNMLIFIFKNFDSLTFLKLLLNYAAFLIFRMLNALLVLKNKAGKPIAGMIAGAASGLLMLRSARHNKARVQSIKRIRQRTDSDYFELFSDEAIFFSQELPSDRLIRTMALAVRIITTYSRLTHTIQQGISKIIIICKGERRVYSLG